MSRTPARITQAEVARIIRAAKQAGAPSVDLKIDGETVATVNLKEPDGTPLAKQREIVL